MGRRLFQSSESTSRALTAPGGTQGAGPREHDQKATTTATLEKHGGFGRKGHGENGEE